METKLIKIGAALACMASVTVFAAVTTPTTPATENNRPGQPAEIKEHHQMLAKLNLTAEQKAKLAEIRKVNAPKRQAARAQMEIFRGQMAVARKAGNKTTMASVRTQIQQAAEVNQALRKAVHEQIMALLTPEQQAKREAILQECRRRDIPMVTILE